jgi:hypothetical protein
VVLPVSGRPSPTHQSFETETMYFEFQVDDKSFQLGGFGMFISSQNPTSEQPAGFSLSLELPLAGLLSLSFDDLYGWDFEHIPPSVLAVLNRQFVSYEDFMNNSGAVPFTQEMADELEALTSGVEIDIDATLDEEKP